VRGIAWFENTLQERSLQLAHIIQEPVVQHHGRAIAGLRIGANTTIYSVMDGIMIRAPRFGILANCRVSRSLA
jgi:hypothetical protein